MRHSLDIIILAAMGSRPQYFGNSRDMVVDATIAVSQVTLSATSDTFCVASDNGFAIETQSTDSHGAILTGVVQRRDVL